MTLVEIKPSEFDVEIDLMYAGPDNFTGAPVYRRAGCYLHADAAGALGRAVALAAGIGLRLKVCDAYRPVEAQWVLWNHTPNPEFLSDPRRGSPHSRGVAVDVTLIDGNGNAFDMGTGVDAFTPLAHHACRDVSPAAQRHRFVLLGIMTAAGWDNYMNEWWHYQLFNPRRYPLLGDGAAGTRLM